MRAVNGWARFDHMELCGATHHWNVYEPGMPCMCGRLILAADGRHQLASGPDAPNVAQRFGIMSHFYDGECDCHPPRPSTGTDNG